MSEYVLAITTCPEGEAESIAYSLVEGKSCAYANIIKSITSIYHWKGNIETDTECLILMKTERNLTDRLFDSIKQVHSYEVPEFVVIPIVNGSDDYLSWISESVKLNLCKVSSSCSIFQGLIIVTANDTSNNWTNNVIDFTRKQLFQVCFRCQFPTAFQCTNLSLDN